MIEERYFIIKAEGLTHRVLFTRAAPLMPYECKSGYGSENLPKKFHAAIISSIKGYLFNNTPLVNIPDVEIHEDIIKT